MFELWRISFLPSFTFCRTPTGVVLDPFPFCCMFAGGGGHELLRQDPHLQDRLYSCQDFQAAALLPRRTVGALRRALPNEIPLNLQSAQLLGNAAYHTNSYERDHGGGVRCFCVFFLNNCWRWRMRKISKRHVLLVDETSYPPKLAVLFTRSKLSGDNFSWGWKSNFLSVMIEIQSSVKTKSHREVRKAMRYFCLYRVWVCVFGRSFPSTLARRSTTSLGDRRI